MRPGSLNKIGVLALTAVLFLAGSCGKEKAPKVDPRAEQVNLVKTQANDLKVSADALRTQLDQSKSDLAKLTARMAELQAASDGIKKKADEFQKSLDKLISMAQSESVRKPWPLYVKVFLILAVIVLVFLLYKAFTREGGDGDEDSPDESFTEESDLGSVRYPGAKVDSSGKP